MQVWTLSSTLLASCQLLSQTFFGNSVKMTNIKSPVSIVLLILVSFRPFNIWAEQSDTTMIKSPYELSYSMTGNSYDWHRLWMNTATLSSAFVGTLLVLECLPEDATSWNRAELQDVPLFKRWHNHVIRKGPEWDHDKFYFNYILHPYAGATYFMAARSCGFNFWRSALYGSIVSTVGWEFGIEAFMERPSIQDIFVTPVVGSCIGEGFYHVKRWLVDNDYRLFGSPVLGGILAFLVDPVNEFTGLWLGDPARRIAHEQAKKFDSVGFSLTPTIMNGYKGFSLIRYF